VNFKKKLQLSIAESIRRKFADESAEYDHVDNIANNQNKFYVIPQTTDYSPFAAVCTTKQSVQDGELPKELLNRTAASHHF